MVSIQCVVTNVPEYNEGAYFVIGGWHAVTDKGTGTITAATFAAFNRQADPHTTFVADGTLNAATVSGTYGVMEVAILRNGGAANNVVSQGRIIARSAARFLVDLTKGLSLQFDAATGQWSGDELVDEERKIHVKNNTGMRRFVRIMDANQYLAATSMANGEEKTVHIRPLGESEAAPFFEHSAVPAIETGSTSADWGEQQPPFGSKYMDIPASGDDLHLTLGDSEDDLSQVKRDVDNIRTIQTVGIILMSVFLFAIVIAMYMHGSYAYKFAEEVSGRVGGRA